jgi:hypothetical protein
MAVERNPRTLTFLFVMIVLCYLFSHIDNGILATYNSELEIDLKIDKS